MTALILVCCASAIAFNLPYLSFVIRALTRTSRVSFFVVFLHFYPFHHIVLGCVTLAYFAGLCHIYVEYISNISRVK